MCVGLLLCQISHRQDLVMILMDIITTYIIVETLTGQVRAEDFLTWPPKFNQTL